MRSKYRILVRLLAASVATAATLALSGACVLSAATGTASAATTTAQAPQRAAPAAAPASEWGWFKYDYYSNKEICELTGSVLVGDRWGTDGLIVDYKCDYTGAKAPLGPWELWILVEPDCGCEVSNASPASGRPGATAPQEPRLARLRR